jgi:hypothetical protein
VLLQGNGVAAGQVDGSEIGSPLADTYPVYGGAKPGQRGCANAQDQDQHC